MNTIELFTGCGGMALGFEKAGFHPLLLNELDKHCCNTLRLNRPQWNVVQDSCANVDYTPFFQKAEVVVGGFPCQAFSSAGKQLGFEDTRGTLFYEFARCVKEVSPSIFIAENVVGLIKHDKGKTLDTILRVFSELGYHVQYKVLNAMHFGVAQKRKRVFIVGTKLGLPAFEFPEEDESKITTLKDVLKAGSIYPVDVPKSIGTAYSVYKKSVMDLIPPGKHWNVLPEPVKSQYIGKIEGGSTGCARRLSWDEPSLTLTTSPSQKLTERCHPDETRPLTIREYARIQAFPDDWQFSGGVTSIYKQIGNAVPVELAKVLATAINHYIRSLS